MANYKKKHILIAGQKFAMLTVVKEVEQIGKRRRILCQCNCGNIKIVDLAELTRKRKKTLSCGCYRLNMGALKHGMTKTRLFGIWDGMKQRCINYNNKTYFRYGFRGIGVCEEWLDNFESFKDWALKNGYKEDLQIDRINNDGNYEPNNCRWVTPKIQSQNRGKKGCRTKLKEQWRLQKANLES